jgi:hypothetical protein
MSNEKCNRLCDFPAGVGDAISSVITEPFVVVFLKNKE